ncbi:response regulator [Microbacterium alcoholitolerans]|uniref:response regulator n=1 Tax=unclassified Microbacterium TaxID=2609290 RepID=UPI003D16CC5B
MRDDQVALRVAIVEDHTLFRSLLESLIDSSGDFTVVASCRSVQEARQQLTTAKADVVLMDIGLPDGNGFGLARSLRTTQPGLGILLLSAHDVMDLLLALPPKERTGWSYLSKTSAASAEMLLNALRITASGGSMLDPELLRNLTPRRDSPLASLTPRQFDALRLLAAGRSNAAIAREMEITPHSVDNLLGTVYGTLGVRGDSEANSRVSAALMMLRHGAPAEGAA